MDTTRRAIDFLHAELAVIDLKINRLESALEACEDCLEGKGLQALLHSASLERDVLRHLLDCQTNGASVSLNAQILERIECAEKRVNRLSTNWRRGKPTPEGYWDAEVRRTVLNELLRRFLDWQHGRESLEVPETHNHRHTFGAHNVEENIASLYAHPWFMVSEDVIEEKKNGNGNGNGNGRANGSQNGNGYKRGYSRSAEMLYEDVAAALEGADLARDHLEVIAEPLGNVIVTGYAHDVDQHQRYIDTILSVDGVFEVIEDIKVVAREDCPLCHPEPLSPNGSHRRNGGH